MEMFEDDENEKNVKEKKDFFNKHASNMLTNDEKRFGHARSVCQLCKLVRESLVLNDAHLDGDLKKNFNFTQKTRFKLDSYMNGHVSTYILPYMSECADQDCSDQCEGKFNITYDNKLCRTCNCLKEPDVDAKEGMILGDFQGDSDRWSHDLHHHLLDVLGSITLGAHVFNEAGRQGRELTDEEWGKGTGLDKTFGEVAAAQMGVDVEDLKNLLRHLHPRVDSDLHHLNVLVLTQKYMNVMQMLGVTGEQFYYMTNKDISEALGMRIQADKLKQPFIQAVMDINDKTLHTNDDDRLLNFVKNNTMNQVLEKVLGSDIEVLKVFLPALNADHWIHEHSEVPTHAPTAPPTKPPTQAGSDTTVIGVDDTGKATYVRGKTDTNGECNEGGEKIETEEECRKAREADKTKKTYFNTYEMGNKLVPKGCYMDIKPNNNNYNWNNHETGAGYKGSIPVCKISRDASSGSDSGKISTGKGLQIS
jgi:hypothetical protein